MSAQKKVRKSSRIESSTSNDYYKVLGVALDATTDEISAAYKRAAKQHHPDRHVTESDAEKEVQSQMLQACFEAYQVLSNSEKRLQYDLFGPAGVMGYDDGDAQAQEAFERIFDVGSAAESQRRRGGALFVDIPRGQFFQRMWDAAESDKMRQEITEGLPTVQGTGGDDCEFAYSVCTTLPYGSTWEVVLVEASGKSLRVTLEAQQADGSSKLRIERVISLPTTAGKAWNLQGAEVAVDKGRHLTAEVPRMECMDTKGSMHSSNALGHGLDVGSVVDVGSDADKPTQESPRTSSQPKRRVRSAKRLAQFKRKGLLKPILPSDGDGSREDAKSMDLVSASKPELLRRSEKQREVPSHERLGSPVSVRMVHAKINEMACERVEPPETTKHDPDVMDRGTWPDDVVLSKTVCPLAL
eukprot:CAMPEP_0115846398 /NCGR_PEP_ID=MMETSP0287-20121206/9841_1 /TAXON_ID=412157 /ORGANISM="Chrysochromulina rotalis, Strain UIO044" /LENGTH=412 /DNA_ID=CAMNT_0003300189 /DNA_START=108 /DNA_END=1346 /DNA_ORIENTATION=+